jgi:hypothetical protein
MARLDILAFVPTRMGLLDTNHTLEEFWKVPARPAE